MRSSRELFSEFQMSSRRSNSFTSTNSGANKFQRCPRSGYAASGAFALFGASRSAVYCRGVTVHTTLITSHPHLARHLLITLHPRVRYPVAPFGNIIARGEVIVINYIGTKLKLDGSYQLRSKVGQVSDIFRGKRFGGVKCKRFYER